MSLYSRNQIREFAISSVSKILPLDDETISQMVDYVLNNLHTREEITKYFTELLGESPDCLDFITELLSMLFGVEKQKPIEKKVLVAPLKKAAVTNTRHPPITTTTKAKNVWEQSSNVESKQVSRQRLSKQLGSSTTSELLDKKPSIQKKTATSKSSKKRALKNLQDIESALSQLEISGSRTQESRKCNCMGTRHPLFEFYPNCLNCGKIICSKEGLQPCSFCGKELLSEKEKSEILNLLTIEKLDIEEKATPTSKSADNSQQLKTKKKEKIKLSLNAAGEHNLKKQDLLFKKLELKKEMDAKAKLELEEEAKKLKEQEEEINYFKERQQHDPELLKAQERLDKLLNFQSTGAERTKIIDRASDFDIPNGNSNMWTSPMERALQLKRQQRQLRKQQEGEKERFGRGRKVLDMSIRDGKVFLREQVVKKPVGDDNESGDDYIVNSEDEEDLKSMKELQSKITKAKLEEESNKIATYWDYEKDKNKWEKPVYLGVAATETDEASIEADEPALQLDQFHRVQFTQEGPEEEMLVSLPTL